MSVMSAATRLCPSAVRSSTHQFREVNGIFLLLHESAGASFLRRGLAHRFPSANFLLMIEAQIRAGLFDGSGDVAKGVEFFYRRGAIFGRFVRSWRIRTPSELS